MQSVLIVEPAEVLRNALTTQLQKHYRVYSCTSGTEGLSLLSEHRPGGLFLNLITDDIDGVYFLEHMQIRPTAIITLSAVYPPHILQKLLDLGVDYSLVTGCPVHAIAHHMQYFMEHDRTSVPPTAQEITVKHLNRLNVPHWGGFDDLRIAVPLYAQDPTQSMVKELYPAVVTLRNRKSWQQVEKAIRDAKEYAYQHRKEDIWKEYFPDSSRCPTNREFIARLADFI